MMHNCHLPSFHAALIVMGTRDWKSRKLLACKRRSPDQALFLRLNYGGRTGGLRAWWYIQEAITSKPVSSAARLLEVARLRNESPQLLEATMAQTPLARLVAAHAHIEQLFLLIDEDKESAAYEAMLELHSRLQDAIVAAPAENSVDMLLKLRHLATFFHPEELTLDAELARALVRDAERMVAA